MADAEALVRLMRHAADRLSQEDPSTIPDGNTGQERAERAASVAVAMAYAEAILRTVAEVMTDAEHTEETH